ncbi:MAG: pilus assembly protein PilM [Halanaerobiales bacterium]
MKLNQPIKLPNLSFDIFQKLKYREKKIPIPKDYIAIDIGSFSLKAVEFDSKRKEITRLLYYPWEQDIIKKNIYQKFDNPEFIKNLCDLLANNSFVSKNIFLLCNYENLVMRPMSMPPNIPKHEINQVLDMTLEDEIPYHSDEVYYDFDIAERTNESTLVHVYAAETKFVDMSIDLFKKFHYEIYKIGVPSMASWSCLKYNYTKDLEENKLVINIDLGSSATLVSIFDSNRLFLYRVISYGGANITRAFEKDLEITNNEAEHYKCENGLVNIENLENLNQLQNNIFEQIWRSIQYVTSRNRMYSLKYIFLSGGSANLKGLGHKLKRYLEIQTQNRQLMKDLEILKIDTFKNVDVSEEIDKNELNDIKTAFSNVVGLSLGDVNHE